jgi:hypothetical protein
MNSSMKALATPVLPLYGESFKIIETDDPLQMPLLFFTAMPPIGGFFLKIITGWTQISA